MSTSLPTRILVPVTFDVKSRAALRAAVGLAAATGAELYVVHVWAAPYAQHHIDAQNIPSAEGNVLERMRHECATRLQEFISSVGGSANAAKVQWSIHSGQPATEILRTIEAQSCDWVVMGTHQRRGLGHWLNGSVAEEVLRQAPCPVLIVPTTERDSAPNS